jgi:PAS domain S-box-containing protein
MRKSSILIVEDESIIAANLACKIREFGHEVAAITPSGEEAIVLSERLKPDLILMDIRLNGVLDGIQAAEAIHHRCDVPIVYLTAHSDPDTLARAKLTGPLGYVLKPFDERDLATQIELALYKHKADRRIHEQREWLKVTLTSIGDAVLTTDTAGMVTFLNPVASALLGMTPEEAVGKPVQDIFRIINEKTRVPAEDIVGRVLRSGVVVALANHTALLAADGREIPIEDSAAPITDSEGHVLGVVLVFHDVTERRRSEDALRKSAERFRALIRASSDAVYRISPDWKDMHRLIGRDFTPATQSIGERWLKERVPPDDRQRVASTVSEAVRSKSAFNLEHRVLRADGSPGWIQSRAVPVLDANGEIIEWLGTVGDITERKQAEKKLIESENWYRTLFKSMVSGFMLLEIVQDDRGAPVDLVILEANKGFEAATGLKVADIVGKRLTRVLPGIEKDSADWIGTYGKVALTGEALQFEHGSELLGGFYFVTAFQAAPNQCCVTFQDITERRNAELALRQSEEQFRAIFDMASIGIAQANPKTGQWIRVNQKMCEITGYSPEEMVALRVLEITHPEDRERDREVFHDVVNNRAKACRLEKRYIRKDGSIVWVNVNLTVVRDAAGNPLRTLATIEDISERKRLEEEHALMEAQLRQAQKLESVGRLAGGVAHDFNNMLGIILGHTDMVLDELDPDNWIVSDLLEIQKAARRSSDLTRQLLAFARKQTIAPLVLDLNEIVGGMLKMLQRLIGEDIDLAWLPCKGVWPVKVDPGQIDQILANLCVNARDAITGVGKITIETTNVVFDEAYCADHFDSVPGEFVLLAVSDNGSGMDHETQARIFEPFFTTKDLGRGTGLGLSTVYGIVKQNNGFINLYSEPDDGTTFKIYLPRHGAKAERMQREKVFGATQKGAETILLVDDEPAILPLTRKMLERLGYTVLSSSAPGQAIRLAEEYAGEIHLLMTDVVMPEMNGRDLARSILAGYPNLKRLFMSGYTANVIAHHGVLDEGVNFIQKPFSMQDLAAKLRKVLGT